jgi:hypothetical protein
MDHHRHAVIFIFIVPSSFSSLITVFIPICPHKLDCTSHARGEGTSLGRRVLRMAPILAWGQHDRQRGKLSLTVMNGWMTTRLPASRGGHESRQALLLTQAHPSNCPMRI